MLKSLALTAAAGYLGVAGLLWFAQESLLFHPQPLYGKPRPPPGWILEEVRFTTQDGTKLAGVLLKPATSGPHPLLISYGGNAEELTASAPAADQFGARAMLLVNYRGYGESEGKPGEAALLGDAIELYDWAAKRTDIDASRIAVHGRSLGTGVAVHVAAKRSVKCVVLTSAYDSIREVAKAHYPWFPIGLLIKHPFDSAALAPKLMMPALFVYGSADTIIGPAHSEKLASLWGGPAEKVLLKGRGHNDLELDPAYMPAITRFLDRHL
ncbi:alpha/beta hydrolase [Usitatibacter palustris]|uniref:Xaa-Pro dipeptidyl-peptidase-like domain-containing protein n=1 Tax=Usitatibacter palustris TaxID=2732487 RepID=A0A6M4HE93_9PROT|nr:alpha/beta hydrolase [Usitatibacter palustris]QJR16924.1 hypothetical protein DSM104440_03761 [Usitatibacter palustris]